MSKKQWYLRIGGALFVVLAWYLALADNIAAAIMACNCIIMIATLEGRNGGERELIEALQTVRAELTNDNPHHEDALSKEHLTAIVCDTLRRRGL